MVDVSNWSGLESATDEVNLISLNVFDDHDLFLGEEVESQVAGSLSKDTLLEQKHVGTGRDDLLDQIEDVLLLFLEQTVHGSVVVNDDVALKVSLGGGERELYDTNFGVLNSSGATGKMGSLLVDKDKTIDELRVINSTAKLGGDVDVVEIGVGSGFLVNNLQNSVHSDRGKQVRVVRHDFGAEGGNSVLNKLFAVIQVNRD